MSRKIRILLASACFSASLMCSGAAFAVDATDYSNWTPTTGEATTGATSWNNADYIRSTTVTTDGTLTTKIIEDYKLGNDGYMYVAVLYGDHLDYFRFPYEYTPPEGGPPDPFGTFGDPNSGTFQPPNPDGFNNGGIDYSDLGNPGDDGGCGDLCPPNDDGGSGGSGGDGGGGGGAAPEPSVYVLMMSAIGLMGGVLRQRQKRRVNRAA